MNTTLLKIAFVTSLNPIDKKSWSGIYYQMYQSLNKKVEVDCIGPISPIFVKSLGIINKITRFLFNKGYNHKNSIVLSYIYSKYFQYKLKNKKYDFIFAPAASTEIAFLKTTIPIIYCSDSSFGQLNEYYDTYSNLFQFSINESNTIEQKAISNAQFLIYPSQWAKNYVKANYTTQTDIKVIPFGANIDNDKIAYIPKTINKNESINLLLLGVDWYRKGGDIVYKTFLELLDNGYNINLTVCGCIPPIAHNKITVIPFLNKNKECDLEKFTQLLQNTHFLFLPSKAECFGIVFCEASAFGIPSITRKTGGIEDAVHNGINGFCLDEQATSHDYFQVIKTYIDDVSLYENLSNSSRALYLKKLNWDNWATSLLQTIQESEH